MADGGLVPDPSRESLRSEVRMLRAELASLASEYDDLVHHQRVNLNARYMLEIGHLELGLHRLACTAMRLRRRIEMIRMSLNRGESPDLEAVDETLDREMAAYDAELERLTRELNRALDIRDGRALSDSEARELKELYHIVVKRLHPDVNPDATPAMVGLYHRAVGAYENADLDAMRAIAESLGQDSAIPDTTDGLERERDRLRDRIHEIGMRMRHVRESHPFDKVGMLDDPEALESRRSEVRSRIDMAEKEIRILRREMEAML